MLRSILPVLAAGAAVSVAACGAGDPAGSSAPVAPGTAKARIERAAHLTLAAEPVPAQAREQGLRASYSNAATAVRDKQVVGVFALRDPRVAVDVARRVRSSAPKAAKLLVHGKVLVVYAAAGTDHGAAVARAVESL